MAYMVLAGLSFTVLNAGVHHVTRELPPVQVAFLRSLFGFLVMTPPFLRYGLAPLRTKRPVLLMLRGLLTAFAMMAMFFGLSRVKLETFAALGFSAPLFASVLALLFLGETFRTRRLLALLGAATWGGAMAVIKTLSRTESSLTITLYLGMVATPVTFLAALFVWEPASAEQILFVVGLGAAGALGHWSIAQAFRHAEVGAVVPLDFAKLLWATMIGYLVFSELPDLWTWVGGTIIFAAGVYVAHRERVSAGAR